MENIKRIRFEDTDREIKIEIYGEEFKLNESKLLELNTDEITSEKEIKELKTILESILGEGSIDKLNKIRKENGYGELETSHILPIFLLIIEDYTNKAMKPIEDSYNNIYNNMNRYEKRNYNNRGYRNNKYRRY